MTASYTPPYRITPGILHSIEQIGEALGNLSADSDSTIAPILRRGNRIKTIQASLAMEEAALQSDQESDYQSDQVIRLLRALRKLTSTASSTPVTAFPGFLLEIY